MPRRSLQRLLPANASHAGTLYAIHVRDNRSHMVGSCDVLDPAAGCPACPACGFRTDADFTAPNFRLRSKRYDLSCCYDGAVIASQRLREACERMGADRRPGFVPLPGAPGFFHLIATMPVVLDDAAMGTRLLRLCPACNRYADRVGFRHPVLQPGQAVQAHELALSAQRYGSHNEAIPLLLAGERFVEMLRAEGITGIDSVEAVDWAPG